MLFEKWRKKVMKASKDLVRAGPSEKDQDTLEAQETRESKGRFTLFDAIGVLVFALVIGAVLFGASVYPFTGTNDSFSSGAIETTSLNITNLYMANTLRINGTTGFTASRLLDTDANGVFASVTDLTSYIAGTSNQITVTDDSDGTITLSLPQSIHTGATPTFATISTGQGQYELYAMNQDVESTDAVVFLTLDTGQGANELYDMDQNVLTSSSPTFVGLTVTNITIGANLIDTNEWAYLDGLDQAVKTTSSPTFAGLTLAGSTDFQNNAVTNLGDAGNDFGATNNFVGSTFSDDVIFSDTDVLSKIDFQDTDTLNDAREIRFGGENWGVGKKYFSSGSELVFYLWQSGSNQFTWRYDGIDGTPLMNLTDGGSLVPPTNNTGAIGADATRWANIWATTITGKSMVTGKMIEMEIAPAPWETFEEGDVVKIHDADYFVKTTSMLDYVVGVVTGNPQQIIIGNITSWSLVPISIGNETVYENVTVTTPIYGPIGNPVLCVAGKAKVKISEPVLQNDILVAGPNGQARPLRTVIEDLKAQYSGVAFNWNNVLTVMEIFNLRTLGQVMEDSNGSYAWAMLW